MDSTAMFEQISRVYDELDYYAFLERTGKPDTPQSLDDFCRLRDAMSILLSNDATTFTRIMED